MKKLVSLFMLMSFAVLTSLSFDSCVSSKNKTSAVREVDSISIAAIDLKKEAVEVKAFSYGNFAENTSVTVFDDELKGSVFLDGLNADSLESTGIKVVANLERTESGLYKVRLKATAKPTIKTEKNSNANTLQGESFVLRSTDSTAQQYANVKSKDKEQEVQKKSLNSPGGFGYSCALLLESDCIVFIKHTSNDDHNGELNRKNKNNASNGDTNILGAMAETVRSQSGKLQSRSQLWTRHGFNLSGKHTGLWSGGGVCLSDSDNGCSKRGNENLCGVQLIEPIGQKTDAIDSFWSKSSNNISTCGIVGGGRGYKNGRSNTRLGKANQRNSKETWNQGTCGLQALHERGQNIHSRGCVSNVLCQRNALEC